MELFGALGEQYVAFAESARGESACFEDWALRVAVDADVQAWLSGLPRIKEQPNLVFAAARWHGVSAPGPYAGLRRALLEDDGSIRSTIMARATQTNEVGRLATLVPVFAMLPGPLALLELGASAGLCLFPDRYDYDWPPRGRLRGSGGLTLTAAVTGDVPLPRSSLEIAHRIGVDLHPLDVCDLDEMAWLANPVWPEQDQRRDRLRAAVQIARAEPGSATSRRVWSQASTSTHWSPPDSCSYSTAGRLAGPTAMGGRWTGCSESATRTTGRSP